MPFTPKLPFLRFAVRLQQCCAVWFVRPPCAGMHGERGSGGGTRAAGKCLLGGAAQGLSIQHSMDASGKLRLLLGFPLYISGAAKVRSCAACHQTGKAAGMPDLGLGLTCISLVVLGALLHAASGAVVQRRFMPLGGYLGQGSQALATLTCVWRACIAPCTSAGIALNISLKGVQCCASAERRHGMRVQ